MILLKKELLENNINMGPRTIFYKMLAKNKYSTFQILSFRLLLRHDK